MRTTCELGCRAATGAEEARCKVFDPTGIVSAEDLRTAGLGDLVLSGGRVNLATGEIFDAANAVIRNANDNANAAEIKNGVRFGRSPSVVVLQAHDITIQGEPTKWVESSVPLVLVATGEVHIETAVKFQCGTLGGGGGAGRLVGGTQVNEPEGAGAGASSTARSGGASGATHARQGGRGGGGVAGSTAGSGKIAPQPEVSFTFVGGSGGGRGSVSGASASKGSVAGGGGGAAVQIIAGVAIYLGDGTTAGATQGLHVGGCGGVGAHVGLSSLSYAAGGGGGSGGFLLLEAPRVIGRPGAGLAANGGGGGSNTSGSDAILSMIPTPGAVPDGVCSGAGGVGGAGAHGQDFSGTDLVANPGSCPDGVGGGGGGGAAGRIVVNTLTTNGVTIEAGAPAFFVSPSSAAYRRGQISAEP